MKRAHSIVLSAFVKADEDVAKVREGLLSLVPFSLADEKLSLQESAATGLAGGKITILEVKLEKERHTSAFLDALVARLSGAQKQQLCDQENRVDEECNAYLRFRKSDLPLLVLTDGGDCIHLRISLAAFPKKRENALRLFKEIFK